MKLWGELPLLLPLEEGLPGLRHGHHEHLYVAALVVELLASVASYFVHESRSKLMN